MRSSKALIAAAMSLLLSHLHAAGRAVRHQPSAFSLSAARRLRLSSARRAHANRAFYPIINGLTLAHAPSTRHIHHMATTEDEVSHVEVAAPAPTELIDLPTNENSPNLFRTRHTTAHIMAMAVQKIFPEAQVTIGPCVDNGFFYDFYMPSKQFTEVDLTVIKKEMDRIIKSKLPIIREEVSREEARRRIEAINEPFKLEILNSIKTEPITIYHIGDQWWDLCAGPHVSNTADISAKAVNLESVAGAYWRGDESKPMLQRIYGTAWESPQQLKEYKRRLEEAKRRDHRLIGKNLNLFSIQEDAGGGLVFWHPKGSIVRRIIEDFWKTSHVENGYELLYTPHIANLNLWNTSGHTHFYSDGMFRPIEVESEKFQLKPMNCPFHCLIFKDALKSYRELPIRWAELGTVYRNERSGTLHGLFRVRGFTQDDAHIFCTPEQLEDEIVGVLDLVERILGRFGFKKYDVMLSTRPEESVGSDDIWDKATSALEGALVRKGWNYSKDEGGGAFYGPKIDLKIRDAIGRSWQCSTVQCDFNLPQRFELEYVAADGTRQQPIMVHRAIFGSIERFFGVLIENTAGDFPLWLAPVQARLLPVTDDMVDYCFEIKQQAEKFGLRVEVDTRSERLGKQIRSAEQDRIPVMCVVGQKEKDTQTLSVRSRGAGELGSLTVTDLLQQMTVAVKNGVELHQSRQ